MAPRETEALGQPVASEGGPVAHKVRVAVADRPGALAAVLTAVEAALVGARVVVELQEVDRSELVVQLDVGVPGGVGVPGVAGPASVLRLLANRTDLEVLSAWAGDRRPPGASTRWPVSFARDGDPGLPPAALRALDDGVPTAWWGDLVRGTRSGDPGGLRTHCTGWALAVPLPVVGGLGVMGRALAMVARAGRLRFDARDAEQLALRCSAHPSLGSVALSG